MLNLDEYEVIDRYKVLKSKRKVAEELNCSFTPIKKILDKWDVERNTCIKYEINDSIFENIDNRSKSYWLGFLYADGSITGKQNKTLRLELKSTDVNHIKEFRNFLGSNHPIKYCIHNKKYSSCYIAIARKKIINDLVKNGCVQNKSKTGTLFPYKIGEDLYPDFIRGFFDGDGSLMLDKERRIYSFSIYGHKDFLKEIQNILIKNCDLNDLEIFDINKNTNKKIGGFCYGGKHQFVRIRDYLFNNNEHSISLDRKKQIWYSI